MDARLPRRPPIECRGGDHVADDDHVAPLRERNGRGGGLSRGECGYEGNGRGEYEDYAEAMHGLIFAPWPSAICRAADRQTERSLARFVRQITPRGEGGRH